MADIALVILAAGEARRFGAIKQLAPFRGRPMAQYLVDACRTVAGAETFIVLGANRSAIEPELDLANVGVIGNEGWREGIASSIRVAVTALAERYSALMFVAADQIAVSGGDLQKLADHWRHAPDRIVAARHGDGAGIPAVFPRSCFRELVGLRGDSGARKLIARYGDRVTVLEMPSAAIDVDTPDTLDALDI